MPKAIVIGGTGFIGWPICSALQRVGWDVITYDLSFSDSNQPYEHRRGSILDLDSLDAACRGMDAVFHIAGVLGTSELLDQSKMAVDVNIAGTVNILEICRKQRIKTVFYPTKPNSWLNTYSITKKAGEDFCQLYANEYGLDVRILRWLNAYGPRQKVLPVRKAVPVMILQALENLDLEIWGTGEQPVDLIHVDNLADITVKYALQPGINAICRDTGHSIRLTVNEMAARIIAATGSRSAVAHRPMRRGEFQNIPVELLERPYAIDIVDNIDALVPLDVGLVDTIGYYSSIPSAKRRFMLQAFNSVASTNAA